MGGCEILDNGTPVYTAPGHTFGTDGLLLARFARPHPGQRAADLCSGCGIVALEWHDAGHRGPCAAVEIDAAGTALCEKSVQAADAGHITPVCADLRGWTPPDAGLYDLAACNPPYFSGGPRSPDAARARARHEDSFTLEDLAAATYRLLRDGGRLTLCAPPARLAEVMALLHEARLEPKRLALVKGGADKKPWLFLLEAQKNRRPGLIFEPDCIVGAGAALYGPGRRPQPKTL